jgi:hypothetical protein
VASIVVGADDRPDEQHRSTRRAGNARNARAERENARIERRRAMQVAFDQHPTGHCEERKEQDQKRDILSEHGMQKFIGREACPEHQRTGHDERQRPEGGDLAEVVVPEIRCPKRQDGNRQQQAGERNDPERSELPAIDMLSARR